MAITRPDRAETPSETMAYLGLHHRLRSELLPGDRLRYLRRRGEQLRRELDLGAPTLAELDDQELLELAGDDAQLEHGGAHDHGHADRQPDRGGDDRVAEVVEIISCNLVGWQRVAPGEFCSWRPVRNGLARVGLDDLELIDRACERLGVERRRCGSGERWRLASAGYSP